MTNAERILKTLERRLAAHKRAEDDAPTEELRVYLKGAAHATQTAIDLIKAYAK